MSATLEPSYNTKRNPKACEACRESKSRCYPSHEANVCQRCLKFHSTCVVRATARPRRSKKATDAFIERTLPAVKALNEENESSKLYIKLPALPILNTSTSVAALGDHHRDAFNEIFCDDVSGKLLSNPSSVNDGEEFYGVAQRTEAIEKVQRSLTIDEADNLLATFRNMSSLFPFVVIRENETVQSMSRTSPFLLLAILTSASSQDVQLHNGLAHVFKQTLGSEVIAMGKKSLDFLQGILVYTCWYPCYIDPKNKQSYMFINLASSMAIDLGLDKLRPSTSQYFNDSINARGLVEDGEFSKAARRAYMGCYYLSASISLGFQKPNSMKYNDLVEGYGIIFSTEAEFVGDLALLSLVRVCNLEEKIREFLISGQQGIIASQLQADAQLQIFQCQLDGLRASTLDEARSMVTFAIADRFIEISLYSYDLGLFRQEPSLKGYLNSRNLDQCLDACRNFFEYLLSIPVMQFTTFTHVHWGWIVQAIVILLRLSFPSQRCTRWDSRAARGRAPLALYLDGLCYRMQVLTKVPPGQTAVPKDPDCHYTLKVVLECIARQFHERVDFLERTSASTDYEHSPEGTGKSFRCPMRDPELSQLIGQEKTSPETILYSTSDNSSSTGVSTPLYFDLWKTMTMGWGEVDWSDVVAS